MRSVQRSLCATMLTLQAIVLGLTTPVLTQVEDLSTPVALSIGLGLALACVLTAGMLRRRWAYYVGWGIQVASLALGVIVPMMIVLGLVFGALWGGAYFLGAKIDREKAQRAVLEEQWAAEHGETDGTAGAGGAAG